MSTLWQTYYIFYIGYIGSIQNNTKSMIFPIGDEQVQGGYKPIFSYSFIALNIIFFAFQMMDANMLICEYGAIPAEISAGRDYHTLFTSMFMHGGFQHIIFNMLFLWVFADNIEATVGNFKFVIFYLAGGLVASAAHLFIGAGSVVENCCSPCGPIQCVGDMLTCAGSVPTVGASGAIAAVLGAYLVMYPKSKIKMFIFFRIAHIPALMFLLFWIGQQLWSGISSNMGTVSGGGTAWWAHIGGFVFGVLFGFLCRNVSAVKSSRENIDNTYV